MSTQRELCESISSIIKDYRHGELDTPLDASHVERWVNQFTDTYSILCETEHLLKHSYWSKDRVLGVLDQRLNIFSQKINGSIDFWLEYGIIKSSQRGTSQHNLVSEFEDLAQKRFGPPKPPSSSCENFIYLDDFILTGNTILRDLSSWMTGKIAENCKLNIIVLDSYSNGRSYARNKLKELKDQRRVDMNIYLSRQIVDELKYTDRAEVLRPTQHPGDGEIDRYISRNFRKKTIRWRRDLPDGLSNTGGFFFSQKTRKVMEYEFLTKGIGIISQIKNKSSSIQPLGYSVLKMLGFGSFSVTYLNCPNTCPLVLWWGNPEGNAQSIKSWYPLLPRRVN